MGLEWSKETVAPRNDRQDTQEVFGDVTARLPRPATVKSHINWVYLVPLVAVHLLAFFAVLPRFYSLSGLWLLLAGTYFYGGIGIDLCYHRLLTHRSFQLPRWLERCCVLVGVCCFEDAPASWVATHRLHHVESDRRNDPHSPRVSFIWSHFNWLAYENAQLRGVSAYERYARDIVRDPFYFQLERKRYLVPLIYLLHGLLYVLAGFGWARFTGSNVAESWRLGQSWLVWGVFVRTVCVWHITWTVNSLSHLFGYRNYETTDNSRNNWLVAVLTSGEGWHNNHHHDPASASNRHRWWEFDLVFGVIHVLEMMGLASNVIRPRCRRTAGSDETRSSVIPSQFTQGHKHE